MTTTAGVLVGLEITDPMMSSCTIAEPAAGEAAWVSGGTYVLGQEVIRTGMHQVYEALQGHTGRTTAPELDTAYWLATGPTLRWAAFDGSVSTPSTDLTSITWVLRPGFFNAIAFYLLDGATLSISIKDAPGGSVVYTATTSLEDPPIDEYDWCFGPYRPLTKLSFLGLLPYPDPEVTITISAGTGVPVGVGMIAIGDFAEFIGTATVGGAKNGATASPVSKSYIKETLGVTTIVKRHSGTDLRVSVHMPESSADFALALMQRVLDVPCALIATDVPGYAGLQGFGLVTGDMVYDNRATATLNIQLKGLV